MKKLLLITLLITAGTALFAADSLNRSALFIKEKSPELYEVIKARAEREWGNDFSMVLYEINKQADGFIYCISIAEEHEDILARAMLEWADEDPMLYENPLVAPINWRMAAYESKKQITAQGVY